MIIFDDGKPIDPSGAWRIEIRKKIRYVLGMNHMIVVDTYEEGIEEIRKLDPEANIVKRYDIAEAKRRAEFFYRGRKYKMVRAGASIRGYMPRGTIWSCTLEVGDIVTYEGFTCREIKTGLYCRSFSVLRKELRIHGLFWPNSWGMVDESFLEIWKESWTGT